jgi:dephospho-CoA kinase
MAKVLITGMSGTGKTTALELLQARGHASVDTDTDAFSQWVTLPDGSADWIWREQAISDLLREHRDGHLFVAGCKTNQGRFYPMFDRIVLLSAPAEVILARIQARTSNPYGKRHEEQAAILEHLAVVEPLLRATATVEIDATAPISAVADQLEELIKAPGNPLQPGLPR